jgi:hypothetical protein
MNSILKKLTKEEFEVLEKDFEAWQFENDDRLNELWDEFKYDKYCGEYFHHDDVDWFNEEFFDEMCWDVYFEEMLNSAKEK